MKKRGTRKLQELGFIDLEVHKGLWGFYAINKEYNKQRGTTCRKTQNEVVEDIQKGSFPIEIKET